MTIIDALIARFYQHELEKDFIAAQQARTESLIAIDFRRLPIFIGGLHSQKDARQ